MLNNPRATIIVGFKARLVWAIIQDWSQSAGIRMVIFRCWDNDHTICSRDFSEKKLVLRFVKCSPGWFPTLNIGPYLKNAFCINFKKFPIRAVEFVPTIAANFILLPHFYSLSLYYFKLSSTFMILHNCVLFYQFILSLEYTRKINNIFLESIDPHFYVLYVLS